ncbi:MULTISPECIES: multiple cyclophane-containing RiPP AmcA [unclassified Plantactinospora]|uniref:multiple cyclophane-containing RiPP AmcA n=1 Tax=unclassified Plantactinospora TaxID=2631981 RepID=UPI000D152CAE|nr:MULTISPECIES: multiple cyclophane-containing RiPP AmcA [unclassified Plantactinospora]AVT33351.1 hypothetical protein C6361_32295 [Plantactinospora sp. BC1]AVT40159.1 hypothetical protein C6W10_31105 [Plantactinospora sp. BB1]
MPEITSPRPPEPVEAVPHDRVAARVLDARAGLTSLLREAAEARRLRDEVATGGDGASAVCAWNHFENIPTFYNWNNRPR